MSRAALAALALLLAACAEPAYYLQALQGQAALLNARRPVAEVEADPASSPALRQQLARIGAAREFAVHTLDLPDNGSYRRYAALGRPAVVWTVTAAPEFSLEAKRWCFVVAGCVPYRGYFEPAAARAEAVRWHRQGFDVAVSPVPAYSSLGWFDDPLLDTFVGWPPGRVAELIFHELAHQKLYVAGDSAFNEAYATTVGRLGAERWLAASGQDQALADYRTELERQRLWRELLGELRAALQELYASALPPAEMRARKDALLTRSAGLLALLGDRRGFALGNAQLALLATYEDAVPAFERLLHACGDDFAAFHRAAARIAAWPAARRAAWMRGH